MGDQGGRHKSNNNQGGQQENSPESVKESYPAAVTLAILAMSPYIVALTAFYFLLPNIFADTGISREILYVVVSLSTAGYAFGALVSGYLVQCFPLRPLFFISEGIQLVGSALSAAAMNGTMMGIGIVLMGLGTGFLLVIALPPVIRRFPPKNLPISAVAINLGFFGALTVGPVAGGLLYFGGEWRIIFIAAAAVAVLNIILGYFFEPSTPSFNPKTRLDVSAITLGLFGTFLTFLAAGEAPIVGFGSPLFIAPLTIGLILLVALLVSEYIKKNPLSPVKTVVHTIPLTGILMAMTGGVFCSLC